MPDLELVRAYHREEVEAADEALDRALGIETETHEAAIPHVATPFAVCRGLFQALALSAHDFMLDLGSGTGRVLLYGAAVSDARFVGVELEAKRAEASRQAARWADRVQILACDARAPEVAIAMQTATVCYAFRPFDDETESAVFGCLAEVGRARPMTLVTHRVRPGRIDTEVFGCVSAGSLTLYRSRPAR